MNVERYDIKDLAQLTKQMKDGDKDAGEKLYFILMPTMKKRALKKVSVCRQDPEIADDIARDVVTQCLFENLNQLKNNDHLIAWVTNCLDNACGASNGLRMTVESYDQSPDCLKKAGRPAKRRYSGSIDPGEEERISLMKTCLNCIRPEYAEMLKMHYFDQLTYREIAAKKKMKESTVVGRMQTARKELKYEMLARAE